MFFVGSLLPALLTGVAVGNIYAGIPLDANGDYTGIPLLGLVTPFTLLCGLLGLSVFLTQGATWLSLKTPKGSDLRGRAAAMRLPLGVVSLVLFALVSVYGHFIIQPEMAPELGILRWLFAILFVVAIVGLIVMAKKGDSGDLAAFLCSSVSAVVLVGLLAASMFPNLVVNTMGENITIATAASSDLSLAWMTGITCVGLPLVLIYHVVIYRTYRGRVTEQEAETY